MIARRAAAGRRPAPPASPAATTWARRAAVALLLGAFALRVHLLSEADIWWDEGLAVWAVRQGLAAAVRWTAGDVHPPLFFAAVWAWLQVAGDSAFALRLGVAFVGLLVTALAWPLGRRLGGPWGGALAVAAVGTSRFLVWWSMELRMYTLAAAAVMVATLGAVRWLDGRRRRDLALYAVGATAALYTVYLAGAALLALNVVAGWAMVARPVDGAAGSPIAPFGNKRIARRDVAEWSAAQVAVLAAFAPWAIYAGGRMSSWKVVAEGPSLWFTARLWFTLLATGVSTDIDAATPWVIAFTAALVLAVVAAKRAARPARRTRHRSPRPISAPLLLLALVAVPLLCVWAITQPRSIFYSPRLEARYFVPFAAPVLAVAAAALARAASRLATSPRRQHASFAALAMLLIAPSLFHLRAYYAPRRATDTLPTMSLAIWSEAEPGDVVVLVSGNRYPLWLYHYDRQWMQPLGAPRYEFPADAPPRWADRPPVVLFPDRGSDPLAAHADWRSKLDGIVDNHERVWLVEYGRDLQDPKDEVEAWLAGRMKRVLSEGYGADALHLFAKDDRVPVVTGLSARWPGTVPVPLVAPPHAQADGDEPMSIHPVAGASARRAAPGDTIDLTLFGRRDDNPALARFPNFVDARISATTFAEGPEIAYFNGNADAETSDRLREGRRVHLQAPITDRAVGGRMHVNVGLSVSVVAEWRLRRPLTVLGLEPAVPWLERPPGDAGSRTDKNRTDPPTFHRLVLGGVGIRPNVVRSGERLVVDLRWQPNVLPNRGDDMVVFVHLIGPPRPDGSGSVWAGQDGPPSMGGWGPFTFDRHVLGVDPAAPSGDYQLEVGIYDRRTGERFPVTGPPDVADAANRRLLIGHVTVR